jgi:hypothetical protein
VINVSVDCAFGAWMVLRAPSLVTADDCLLAGRLGVLSLPVSDSNTLPRGSNFK